LASNQCSPTGDFDPDNLVLQSDTSNILQKILHIKYIKLGYLINSMYRSKLK